MAGELDAERLAAKRWANRNADGKDSFGDEFGRDIQTHAPPSFTEEEHPLPPGTVQWSTPDDSEEARSLRHVHVFDPDIVEPS